MKTTKIYLVVCLTFILTQFNALAQYNGGNSAGFTLNQLNGTSCAIPSHFYAYFGGLNDGSSVNEFTATACGTAPFQFAYLGGAADGAATEEFTVSSCGTAPFQFAYMGGNNDGAGVETFEPSVCAFPPQFYAYFGGSGDGFHLDKTAPICPTEPPVADFTASATTICVGQSVTFTDTSTNVPGAWTWTLPGATPNNSTAQNPTVVYNTAGTYTVTLQAANFNGLDTKVVTNMITVSAFPTVTSTAPASRCDTGTVTLGATASAGTLNWYANPTGGTALGTGTSFITPSIGTTTTYYVETAIGSCTSARTAVVATVNTTPTITSTTPASRCDAGSVTLNATSSAGSTIWYAASTGGTALSTSNNFVTPSINATTTYYVEASLGGCTSARTAVVAAINTTPTITSTTPGTRCDSGTLTLTAVASSGTLNWYSVPTGGSSLATGTSFTTPNLSGTATYYVAASNASCTSARIAVTATVNATPTVTAGSNSRCGAGVVLLSASTSAGTISWYANASGGSALGTGSSFTTPGISTTTTYYAEAVNGTCTSARIPVVATINTSPTITSTTPATICGGDTFTISAATSAGTLAWYNVATGGIVQGTGTSFSLSNWGTTTTFYVQATDGTCQSVRTPVIVTVNQRPFNTTANGASRCGAGTLALSATYTNGTINWYDAAIGGNLVFTGSNFVTPTLSTTTTYYVEGVNGTCVSTIRTAVTATVNTLPVITATTPASRCGSGIVTLSAVSSVGNLVWYNVATGGTALATGTSFSPSISNTTTYYVEATNGTCTSTRTAVIATIDVAESITSTTPGNRCDTGSVTLSAVATGGTLNWYSVPTGGSILGTGASFVTPSLSSSTTYYVAVTNGTCTSARIAVVASVNGLAAPTGNANQSFCTSGNVGSIVTTSGTNIVWYTAATGGTVVPNSTALVSGTTYYASQNNGTCESATRLGVTVTLNTMPTVTSTTPASRCGAGIVTLNAASSIGTLVWHNVSTGGTALATGTSFSLSISGTTTYYVEAVNGACTSARTAVVATIDAAQTITSTTPGSRCDGGTVTLNAAATGGTLNWYAAATGGSVLGTGSNFTTPSISASTTYYVEVTNGTCTSARIAVTASINPVSAPSGNANQQFCAGETVGLLVITSGTNIVWYNAATGGTVVPNGTLLVSGTTYYASQNNGTCESPARLAVTATLGNCLGNDEFAFSQIKLWPNPVNDMLNITNTELMSKVTLIDMLGRVLSANEVNDLETKVDMARYPTGTYLVQVTIDNAVKTFKVIKK
ncbi:MAG: T9SS type A sorting domain-containing protein [Flavobacterium sp. JAD_PAG50586_2]|nr:MAG: T9SS type A sorting domain-containing protein [Flavobacterium sp. JAD_PAG50586_2]